MRIFLSKRDRARPPPFFTRARDIIWRKHQAKGWVYSARFLSIPLSPSLSLSLSPSLPPSLSLISPSLSISLLLPFFLSLSFSLSSLYHSLAYLMDFFVLVTIIITKWCLFIHINFFVNQECVTIFNILSTIMKKNLNLFKINNMESIIHVTWKW